MKRTFAVLLLVAPIRLFAAADAHEILAEWRHAVAGHQRLDQIHSIHRVASSVDDATSGTRDEWIGPNGFQRLERVDHGRDDSVTVLNRDRAWIRDWNGHRDALQGNDLKWQIDLAVLHGFAALTGKAGEPHLAGDDGNCTLLRFDPAGGQPITYCIDRTTALPVRASWPSFDGAMTTTFSDWREVDGIKVPFAEKRTDGVTTTELHLQSIRFNEKMEPLFTAPEPGPRDAFFLQPGETRTTVPFNFDNSHIMVRASVNGTDPLWFIIDTGAGYWCLNTTRAAEMHLSQYGGLRTEGGGTSTGGSFADKMTFRVGDTEVRNQHGAVFPFHGLERLYGVPLGGLIGYDFLSRFVVQIDYPALTLTFIDPASFDYHGNGHIVPLVMQEETPYFDGSITVAGERIPTWYILDTGAADTITFTTPFVEAHHLVERAGDPRREKKTVAGIEGEFYTPTNIRGLIDTIRVDGAELPHVPVNLSANSKGAYASGAFSGNIGETILRRFPRVILDYPRRRMIVEADAKTTAPFEERKTFGLTILADGPRFTTFAVTAVRSDSPAARAGFAKGDVITAIDSTTADGLTLAKVKAIFDAAGTRHAIGVDRKGETVTIPATIELVPISGLR